MNPKQPPTRIVKTTMIIALHNAGAEEEGVAAGAAGALAEVAAGKLRNLRKSEKC